MVSFSVAIQAGGKSSRMGQDKGLLKFGDLKLVEYIYQQISNLGEEVFIVSNNREEYLNFGLPVYSDIYKNLGALGGIHTVLSHLEADYGLILACDMPFVNIDLVNYMSSLAQDFDVVVPRLEDNEFVEPFKAFYSKSCLPAVETAILNGKRRVVSFFEDVKVRIIEPAEVKIFDPDFNAFINVNTPDDYKKALELAGFK